MLFNLNSNQDTLTYSRDDLLFLINQICTPINFLKIYTPIN